MIPSTSGTDTTMKTTSNGPDIRRCSIGVQFPWKMHLLLDQTESQGLSDIVSWMPGGNCFKVHNKALFEKEIMPHYFKTKTYKSFQRNLNVWGFETKQMQECGEKRAIYHPLFRRGQPNLCQLMSRVGKIQPQKTTDGHAGEKLAHSSRALLAATPEPSASVGRDELRPHLLSSARTEEKLTPNEMIEKLIGFNSVPAAAWAGTNNHDGGSKPAHPPQETLQRPPSPPAAAAAELFAMARRILLDDIQRQQTEALTQALRNDVSCSVSSLLQQQQQQQPGNRSQSGSLFEATALQLQQQQMGRDLLSLLMGNAGPPIATSMFLQQTKSDPAAAAPHTLPPAAAPQEPLSLSSNDSSTSSSSRSRWAHIPLAIQLILAADKQKTTTGVEATRTMS